MKKRFLVSTAFIIFLSKADETNHSNVEKESLFLMAMRKIHFLPPKDDKKKHPKSEYVHDLCSKSCGSVAIGFCCEGCACLAIAEGYHQVGNNDEAVQYGRAGVGCLGLGIFSMLGAITHYKCKKELASNVKLKEE